MHPYINTAIKAARRAGTIISRAFQRLDMVEVSRKGEKDFVTNVDKAAEKEIIHILHEAYPDHSFLAEESEEIENTGLTKKDETRSDLQWIIDPLDGTTNFIHGFPHFSVSIALKIKNRIEHAVIYDPIKEDLFTATRGEGAQKNSRRIRVSDRKNIEECLLAFGFPFRCEQQHNYFHDLLKSVGKTCVGMRRAGSAALDLAYVGSGQLDGFFELGLSPWDMAAGILIIKEAGGLVTDWHGGESYLKTGHLVAGNKSIFKPLLKLLQPMVKHLHESRNGETRS